MDFSSMTFFPVCPHCGAEKMTFYRRYDCQSADGYLSFWQCAGCRKGVCGESAEKPDPNRPFPYSEFTEVYPTAKSIGPPQYTPDVIACHYKTAVKDLRRGSDSDYEASCIMARKALETAVNQIGAGEGVLKQKIEELARSGGIPQAMAEWAHEIRNIGNDAAHDNTPMSKKDAEQTVYFTEMLLTYLYTLPGIIAERRQKT